MPSAGTAAANVLFSKQRPGRPSSSRIGRCRASIAVTDPDALPPARADANVSALDPLDALGRILGGVDVLRNLPALATLLGTFASAGLLLATAEASFARGNAAWGPIQAGAAFTVAFYGGNAAGLLVMDQARGLPVRAIGDAVRDALASAHRLLGALALILALGLALAGALTGLLWLSREAVAGPWLGPVLFGLLVPVAVLGFGAMLLALLAVIVPLAAPALWSGAGSLQIVRELLGLVRTRLLTVALLMAAASLLAGAVGAATSFVVMAGGRIVAELGVAVVGIDVPAVQLMSGLFGRGLRSLGAAGAPVAASAHGAAALIGGGVVFALALVLPGLVYLRGACAVYLALQGAPARRAP